MSAFGGKADINRMRRDVRAQAVIAIEMIAESLETALSAMQATGLATWAALSTSGLRALELPPDVRNVVVLADGDEAGEAAAWEAARRWNGEGRRVRIARPPRGLDFNDVLAGRVSCDRRGAA
jgi:hypothetical protein